MERSITGRVLVDRIFNLLVPGTGTDGKDPDSEVFRYYSIANKLDDTWFSGAYALSQACMSVFEANGYQRSDALAVNSYSESSYFSSCVVICTNYQLYLPFEVCSTVSELRILQKR
jgi:hypothetical protein